MMDQLVQHNNQQRSMIERFSEADAEQFSFRDLISKIFLRPKIFLLALLLPAIVSVWFVALVPQDWEASTKILIRYSKTDTGLLKGLVADAGTSLSGSTSAELIKSVPVLKATIKDVGINADDIYRKPLSVIVGKIAGPFKKWLGNEEKEQTHNESESSADKALLSAFKKSLDSSSKQSSKKSIQILDKHSQTSDTAKLDELISLNVKSYNREKVALMANGLSKAFIDHFYDLYAQAAHNQSVYLSTLVRDQETELNTVLRAKPSDFNSGKIDTHIRKSISRDTPMLRTITAQLNDTRNELRRVSQVYTHDTPKVKRLQALVSKLSFQLKKQELVEMHKQLLEQLKTRQFQAQNTENIFKNRFIPINIVEEAIEPEASNAGKVIRIIITAIIGLILGLLFALSLMIVLSVIDPRVHFRREIESLVSVPVMTSIPKISLSFGEFQLKHFKHLRKDSDVGDSFFKVISTVGQNAKGVGKVITIAGVSEGDGTTFCAIALALNLAKNKSTKVCLIDANFSSPMITKLFDADAEYGLIEGLVKAQPLTSFGTNVSFNFTVIGAGNTTSKSNLGFYLDAATKEVNSIRDHFDYIIIDTGTALKNNEACVFGGFAEETLVVASSGHTRKGMLQAAIQKLQSNGNKVTGILFNQTRQIIPRFIYRMF